ncbi:MAG TPA: flagellar basal body L-ring protein FlgH [Holophaga sp.]|nr:flagellar basal body L-ring protein FlgH [Holophaga sp.]
MRKSMCPHAWLLVLAPLMLVLATGCYTHKGLLASPKEMHIPYTEESAQAPSYADGSLWRDISIYSDPKARNQNDLITLKIVESTSADSKASTDTSRNGSNTTDSGGLLNTSMDVATSTTTKYKGSGETARSATLTTRVTARVVRVLANGNLLFEGFRDIQVNNETQRLYVAGIANPLQIDSSNTISSDQVAELRIGYGGKGVVDETQKPGYISRLLNLTWPF